MTIEGSIANHGGELDSMFEDTDHSLATLFADCVAYLDSAENTSVQPEAQTRFPTLLVVINRTRDVAFARTYLAFGKARLTSSLDDSQLTHVVVSNNDRSRLSQIRSTLSTYYSYRFS